MSHLKIQNNPLILGCSGNATASAYGIYMTGDVNNTAYITNNPIIRGTEANAAYAYGINFDHTLTANPAEITDSTIVQGASGNVSVLAEGIGIDSTITNLTIDNIPIIEGAGGNAGDAYGINFVSGSTLTINSIATKVIGCEGDSNGATGAYGIKLGSYTDLTIDSIPLIQGAIGNAFKSLWS